MNRAELEQARASVRVEIKAGNRRIAELEAEVRDLQLEVHRLQALDDAFEGVLSPEASHPDAASLTDTIINLVRQRGAPGLPASSVARRVAKLVPSVSDDPEGVARVRIRQLIKEGRLMLVADRVQLGPKENVAKGVVRSIG